MSAYLMEAGQEKLCRGNDVVPPTTDQQQLGQLEQATDIEIPTMPTAKPESIGHKTGKTVDADHISRRPEKVQLISKLTPQPDSIRLDNVPWKGWAELENDPVIFTAVLRAWGVRDVTVNEVIPLEAIYDKEPSSILGLIFLSRWIEPATENEATECPNNIWFANQISTFSCATLALMNIINNREDTTLGEELHSFKENTKSMTPKERGLQLDNFQFVKDVHNSFSRELDRMHVDLRLKEEVQASTKKARRSRKKYTTRKKKRCIDDDDESGFHFVAYVPAQGHLWRLDGLEAFPRDMGVIEPGDIWLYKIIGDIQFIFETSEEQDTEFSLLSLNHETDSSESATNSSEIERMKEDWSPFIAHMLRLHAEKGNLDELLA